MRLCALCKKVKITGHLNKKYCEPCRKKRLSKPKGTLTKKQIQYVKKWAGKKDRHEIAKDLGVSLSNIKRSCPGLNLTYHYKYCNNPKLVEKVCKYYEKHGKRKTQEKFPDVAVRSIVERYKKYEPRQLPWTDEQLIELTKMAGLISMKSQAKYFNRPLANEGSIRSVWVKRFGHGQRVINGMAHWKARHFIKKSCPVIDTPFGSNNHKQRHLVLWVDFEKHIKDDCPKFIKEAVSAMADFQRKLYGVKDVRGKVKRLIKNRETIIF
jgi:hypothetical protein